MSSVSSAVRMRPSTPLRVGVQVLLLDGLDSGLELDFDLRSSEDEELDLFFSDLFALFSEPASLRSDLDFGLELLTPGLN